MDQRKVKNPNPKDLALNCLLRGLKYAFLCAAVCWSGGVITFRIGDFGFRIETNKTQ
jgi:hypothetical protein